MADRASGGWVMGKSDIAGEATANAIMVVAAALMMIGVVAVASASGGVDRSSSVEWWRTGFGRQLIFVGFGLATMLMFSWVGPQAFAWRHRSWWQPSLLLVVLAGACLSLALIPGIGLERNGARRWLSIGTPGVGPAFQPSEMAKVALVVFLAAFVGGRSKLVGSVTKLLLPSVAVIAVLTALVGVEDFGTAALLGLVGGAILLVGGCRLIHLVVVALPGIATGAYLVYFEPYRMERLTSFADIWADPQGSGYHAIQSLATIASGGWFGSGLGSGIQKYGYLPASQTDFIFSVWCEETGVFGGLLIVLLFVAFLLLGLRAMRRARSSEARLLAFGVTLLICLQAVINLAVVSVVAPTKGIALPFVSAGGSGVVFLAALVGLLAGVARTAAVSASTTTDPSLQPSSGAAEGEAALSPGGASG
ncbi:MAG: cell division protein FtsW [bacterium]|nr:cell division protein FtsW [bacterium]